MTITSNLHIGLTAWASGQTITIGNRRSSTGSDGNQHAYQATNAGTTGATAPNIISTGTVSDGNITWKWLSKIDYTSISAWIAGIPSTPTQPIVGLIWNNGVISTPSITISGITTSSTNNITLQAAPGESFWDNPNAATNKLTYDHTKGVAIECTSNYGTTFTSNISYITIIGIMLGTTSAQQVTNGAINFDRCILLSVNTGYCINWRNGNTSQGAAVNCLVIMLKAGNPVIMGEGFLDNCTIVVPSNIAALSSQQALYPWYGTMTVRNCAILGFGGTTSGTMVGQYNAFDVSSANTPFTSSNSIYNVPRDNTTFVNAGDSGGVIANMDFRLATSSRLIDAGFTITGSNATNKNNAVVDTSDVYGTSRPQGSAWDIGLFEYKSAVKKRSPQLMIMC